MSGANRPYTQLSANQVLQQVFDEDNDKLRVDATVTANIAGDIQCEIEASDGDNIAIANADGSKKVDVETFDGKNALDVHVIGNPLDVNIVGNIVENPTIETNYAEVTSVASSVLTTVISYTSAGAEKLQKVDVSGTNIAQYEVYVNLTTIDKRRTYFGSSLNSEFDFKQGIPLDIGDVVAVKVIHSRPSLGDFNARVQVAI